jgi:hypothetical protein
MRTVRIPQFDKPCAMRLCGFETLAFNIYEEHWSRVFGSRVLRRTFERKTEEDTGERRKLGNEKLHILYPVLESWFYGLQCHVAVYVLNNVSEERNGIHLQSRRNPKYCYGYEINEDEMDGTRSTYGGVEKCVCSFCWTILNISDLLGDLRVG